MLYFSTAQKIFIFILCFIVTPYFLISNFLTKEDLKHYPFLYQNQINLGLDLQGGAHLAFEADMESYYQDHLKSLKSKVRKNLRPDDGQKRLGYRALNVFHDHLALTVPKKDHVDLVKERLKALQEAIYLKGSLTPHQNYLIINEDNRFTIRLTKEYKQYLSAQVIDQAIEVMRRRIDGFGTKEPNILRHGNNRIILQLAGENNIDEIKNQIGKTARMTFQMVSGIADASQKEAPEGFKIYDSLIPGEARFIINEEVILSGDNLVHAGVTRDESGRHAVSFTFDQEGAYIFADTTQNNIGNLFAIILDEKVVSAPRIQSAIIGGKGIISGNFTAQEASNTALLLRSGSLPVNLNIVEERTVGSELGKDSIQAGKYSLIYGFILVALFMIFYYGLAGIFSVFALSFNVLFIFAALTLFSATLTLPGIAGIVLGMGVAVDANVLIVERIREEMRRGIDAIKAIHIGYERAWVTILDSHLTGFVSAVIMFLLGTGPIRGFAVTLALGVVISFFTSIYLSRLCFSFYVFYKRPIKMRFGLSGA